MDLLSGIYFVCIGLAGSVARAVSKGIPKAMRVRLEARPPNLKPGWIWLHAVSVGELILATGLLGRLLEDGYRVHVTTSTQAGLELLRKRLSKWDDGSGRITGGGFPIDDPIGLKFFFESPPGAFIALETEIWPNLFVELESRNIPACIVNGRLTARTMGSMFKPWLRNAASRLSLVVARDAESANNFGVLGASNVVLGGNLKADQAAPPALHDGWETLRAEWSGNPIVVAGNTVDGEEELVIDAWKHAKEDCAGLRLIIAPRQPGRFDLVAKHLGKRGIVYLRAANPWPLVTAWKDIQVLLLDTLGELASVYSLGQIAIIGGGWRWHGGHNPMEPLYWGLPTLIGPSYTNFEDLVTPLLEAGCLEAVEEAELGDSIRRLLPQIGTNQGQRKIPDDLKGCTDRTWEYLKPHLPTKNIF
ncbi:MAG: hypothetical protein FWG12_03640 [Holophagaceae bacterium]|nr:hypothetical protein [Holophagaceae bacterium]